MSVYRFNKSNTVKEMSHMEQRKAWLCIQTQKVDKNDNNNNINNTEDIFIYLHKHTVLHFTGMARINAIPYTLFEQRNLTHA